MRTPLLLLLIACNSSAALAQSRIQGRVASSAEEAVLAATVTLLRGAAVLRRTATDSTGRFLFDDVAADTYALRVERIGFQSQERRVIAGAAPVFIDIVLREAPVVVEGVTVEGERTRARFQSQAGATTRELSKAELKLIPGLAEADVLRAIESLPGVVSTSDFSSAYNVRGGSADQNLILLDGIPVYNPFHLGGLFSVFNSDMVERAELLAGGFPAEYGGRVSSVLNVVSDPGSGGFDVRGGVSILATRVAVGAELPAGTARNLGISSARVRIAGRRSYFDQLFKPFFDFPYYLTDLQLAAKVWTSTTSRFTATAYTGNDVLNFAGVDSFPLRIDWHWGNSVAGVAWRKHLRSGAMLDVHSSYSRFSTRILFPDFGDTRLRSSIDHALLHAAVTAPFKAHQAKAGVELNRLWYLNRAEAGGTTFRRGSEVGWQPTVFGQVSLHPSAPWLLEGGVRADAWRTEASSPAITELSPRLAVKRFLAGGDAALKLALGRYTQFLHSLRDEELPIGIDVWVLTGQRAPHVLSKQVQAGLEWFPATGWYASLETFRRSFDGVTTNNFGDDPNTDSDDLLNGTGLSYGADAVVRKDRGALRGFVTASWLRTWREFPDLLAPEQPAPRIRYAPLFDRRFELDMLLRLALPRGWESGVRWNFGTGLPYTRPVGSYLYYQYRLNTGMRHEEGEDSAAVAVLLEPRNQSRYPAYHRLDFSLRKLFHKSWGTLTPHIDVLNVYNRKNVLFYFYDYNRTPAVRSGVSMFPLLPTAGVEIVF